MFAKKSRKDQLIEQAQSLASDLGETLHDNVERAREELAPRLAEAREQVQPHVESAKAAAKTRYADDVAPLVAQAAKKANEARTVAAENSEEARRRGQVAVAALKGEPVKKKGGKFKKFVIFGGLLGAIGLVVKKLTADDSSNNWQTSYTPATASGAGSRVTTDSPVSGVTGASGVHKAESDVTDPYAEGSDLAAAAPGEALSDSLESPVIATTPADPVVEINVEDPDQR